MDDIIATVKFAFCLLLACIIVMGGLVAFIGLLTWIGR